MRILTRWRKPSEALGPNILEEGDDYLDDEDNEDDDKDSDKDDLRPAWSTLGS